MSDLHVTPRRRRLWPVFVAPGLFFLLAVGWSVFWFVAAGNVDQAVDEWRAREAAAGRVYDCGKRSVAGYPFRLEVTCENASVTLRGQTAEQAAAQEPFTAKLGRIVVIAQVYDPRKLIADFIAPATVSDAAQKPVTIANWKIARASIAGLPGPPQRLALVFDDLAVDRVENAMQVAFGRAKHVELHARMAETSTTAKPVIDAAIDADGASVQDVHPVLLAPFNLRVGARLSGLRDLSPKPWPERLRELQANGGKLEIAQARISQGNLLATGAGTLGISPNGKLDGELQMVVAGLEAIVPALGIDKILENGIPQGTLDKVAPGVNARDVNNVLGSLDRMVPGLTKMVRQNAGAGMALGVNAIGTQSELEGRKARAFPLRFVDGAVYLGALKIADTPPLF